MITKTAVGEGEARQPPRHPPQRLQTQRLHWWTHSHFIILTWAHIIIITKPPWTLIIIPITSLTITLLIIIPTTPTTPTQPTTKVWVVTLQIPRRQLAAEARGMVVGEIMVVCQTGCTTQARSQHRQLVPLRPVLQVSWAWPPSHHFR